MPQVVSSSMMEISFTALRTLNRAAPAPTFSGNIRSSWHPVAPTATEPSETAPKTARMTRRATIKPSRDFAAPCIGQEMRPLPTSPTPPSDDGPIPHGFVGARQSGELPTPHGNAIPGPSAALRGVRRFYWELVAARQNGAHAAVALADPRLEPALAAVR